MHILASSVNSTEFPHNPAVAHVNQATRDWLTSSDTSGKTLHVMKIPKQEPKVYAVSSANHDRHGSRGPPSNKLATC